MCTFYTTLFGCLLTLLPTGTLHTQWVQTSGPYGGDVRCFAASGTNLFAGTASGAGVVSGGVFLSTNNGASWTQVNNGLTNTSVTALTVSGTNLFAGTGTGQGGWGRVYLSTNNGTSWTEVDAGLPIGRPVSALAVSGTNLFDGIYYGGVFLSTNNGTSWTAVNNGLTNTEVRALAVSGTNLFAGTYLGGVFLSTNNGTSWTAVNSGLTCTIVHALAVSGTNLFAGTEFNGVYLSTNNGTSWTAVNTGLTNTYVCALAVSGTNLFAGTFGGGVFLSTNNGASWTQVNNGLTVSNVFAFAVSGTNLFAGTGGGGVFLSTNNGASWTQANTGLTNTRVQAFAVSDSSLFAGTNGGGVYLSNNNGTSWTEVNNGLTNTDVHAFAVSGTNLFAGTGEGQGVFLSTNNGTSWTQVNTDLTNLDIGAFTVSGTNLFAGTSGGVFLSTDNGTFWTATGLTADVSALAASGTNLFAGTRYSDPGGGVFLSTNNGTSWTPANTPFGNFSNMVQANTNLFAGTQNGVFLSTNNGTSWTEVFHHSYVSAFAISHSDVFATDYYCGEGGCKVSVFLTTDQGTSWTDVSSGLPWDQLYPGTLTVSGTYLLIGGRGGVWRRPLSEMVYPIRISSPVIEFGDVNIDSSAQQSVTIYNDGVDTLKIDTTGIGNEGFTVQSICNAILPGDSCIMTVLLRPLSYGRKTCSMRVLRSDGARIVEVLITANISRASCSQEFTSGWNLFSLPLALENSRVDDIYPGAASHAFDYCGKYTICDSLEFGKGYWLKVGESRQFIHHGSHVRVDTITVLQGWNIIGSLSSPFLGSSITSEPPGIVTGSFWMYDGTQYVTSDTINPGKGYWVKVNQAGELISSASVIATTASNRIQIVPRGEQPPLPPGEEILKADRAVPKEYALAQAYPNPFNPSATIRYDLPVSSWVTIKVYDMLGREVATLINGVEEPGYKSVQWDAGRAVSGVYFYRLQTGSFVDVKKLTLLK